MEDLINSFKREVQRIWERGEFDPSEDQPIFALAQISEFGTCGTPSGKIKTLS
jgi:hypothetical protein